ncbi:MAG: hypothetical protein ACR2N2_04865 [Acidimicrobiia bacterium]
MAIVLFILIAGLWAAFLLPSFFDHRSQNPRSTTRDFARTRQLLATVSASDPASADYVRRHTQVRRTRILIGLGVAAAVTLGVATWTGSVAWLWAAIAIDVIIALYVTSLLHMKRQRYAPRAQVVPIASQTATPSARPAEIPAAQELPETSTVRVIAG